MRKRLRPTLTTFCLVFLTTIAPMSAFGQIGQSTAAQAVASSGPGGPSGQSSPVRRLSVNDAVQLALEQNLSLQVQRLEPQLQDLTTLQVKTAWTPTLSSTITNDSATNPVSSFLAGAGGASQLTNKDFSATFGAAQLLPTGADYSVTWRNTRASSNSIYSTPNPSLGANLSASVSQPLLKNFKIDSTRQQLLISRKNREMTDVQLRQVVLTTIRSVKSAYWDLAYAVANYQVQLQSLDIARESLKNNKSRVDIGTMAPIDIIEAQAEVARNEESVILAEAQITRAEDALRQLIFDPKTPDFWNLKLELSDKPEFKAQTVDVEAAVKNALDKRTDLANQRKNLEAADINIRYYRNQMLPDLSLTAGYGMASQGGTAKDCLGGFSLTGCPEDQVVTSKRSYGSTLSKMFNNDYHNWSVGVTLSYPLGRSSAEASLARAKVSYSQSQLQLRNAELQVASQVREIARQLNTNRKRVDATRASRELSEKKLEAQQKKFAAGMSTTFEVIQAQRDLASARNSELSAILDYNLSLVDFETVQEAPIGGGSGVTLATSGS